MFPNERNLKGTQLKIETDTVIILPYSSFPSYRLLTNWVSIKSFKFLKLCSCKEIGKKADDQKIGLGRVFSSF